MRVDGEGGWKHLLEDTVNLESIVLYSSIPLHPEEVVDLFGFFTNKGFHRAIHWLSLATPKPCDLTPHILIPLHNFKSLTRLSVTSPCDLVQCNSQLTDGALAQLAEALPQLVELFRDVSCGSPARGLTLAGLRPLSIDCVHLETLQVHFSALDIPSDIPEDALTKSSDQPPLSPNHCRLFLLVVGARSPLIVAYFLHQMFPRLSKVLRTVTDSPWKEVQEHIDVFQKYRPKQ